jgi:hypothetical protein
VTGVLQQVGRSYILYTEWAALRGGVRTKGRGKLVRRMFVMSLAPRLSLLSVLGRAAGVNSGDSGVWCIVCNQQAGCSVPCQDRPRRSSTTAPAALITAAVYISCPASSTHHDDRQEDGLSQLALEDELVAPRVARGARAQQPELGACAQHARAPASSSGWQGCW